MLAKRDAIREIGSSVEEIGSEGSGHYKILFNAEENSPPFNKERFHHFIHELSAILPYDGLESVYLIFYEEISPNPELLASFEKERQRLGITRDYKRNSGSLSITVKANDETVRDITHELPNDLELSCRLERNENTPEEGHCYDLIGECAWKRDSQPHGYGTFSDVHLNQMTRLISKMRTKTLGSMKTDSPSEMKSA